MPRIIKNIFYTLCVLTACGCRPSAENNGKKVFNINLDQNLTSIDPAFARNQNALWMINQVFNGLVQVDNVLNVVPAIAKSWEVSADGKDYTFHLR
ncbi:MAG TPA: ABC transporter substrate-binding protein, partial [Pedobacter sp.]